MPPDLAESRSLLGSWKSRIVARPAIPTFSGVWAEGFETVLERDSDPEEWVGRLEPAPAAFVSNV